MSKVHDDTAETPMNGEAPKSTPRRSILITVLAVALIVSVSVVIATVNYSFTTASPVMTSRTAAPVSPVVARSTVLQAPGNLALSSVQHGGIQLAWSSLPPEVGLLGYRVYRRTGSSSPYTLLGEVVPPLGKALHTYVDDTIVMGHSYAYTVTGFNRSHEGPPAGPLFVVPVSVAPPPAASATSQALPAVASFCVRPPAAPTLTALAGLFHLRTPSPAEGATARARLIFPTVKPVSTLVPTATSTSLPSHR